MIVSAILAIVVLYILSKLWPLRKLDYWEKRGIPGPKPSLIYGNTKEVLKTKSSGELYDEIYKQYDDLPYVGMYNMRNPQLLIRDVNLIRNIFINDFKYFQDNGIDVSEKCDPLLGKNPFFLKGDKWNDTRTHLLPAFSAAKAKTILPNVDEVAKRMIEYITNHTEKIFEMKDLASRFTTDSVFSILYSMNVNSFDDSKAEMWKLVRKFFVPSPIMVIRMTFLFLFPRLSAFLNLGFFPAELQNSLINLAKDARKERQGKGIIKNDLFEAFSELKNRKTGAKFDEMDMAAHSSGFITDGLETTAITMSFLLYELAANQHVQNKLYEEITSVLEAYGNELTPEAVHEMKYLDGACHETLRMHPAFLEALKRCTQDYTVPAPYGKGEFVIEKGTVILIPPNSIHMDPKLHPNPEVFDPERFSSENREKMVRGSYIGFGDGPRMCIGQRYGLTQLKVGTIHLLKNFKLEVDERTIQPLKNDPAYFLNSAKGGIWIKFAERCTI